MGFRGFRSCFKHGLLEVYKRYIVGHYQDYGFWIRASASIGASRWFSTIILLVRARFASDVYSGSMSG